MTDLMYADLGTVQSIANKAPVTIASTTTIAPSTFVTFVSGNTAIATLTPPVTGAHMLCLIHTHATPVAYTTAGNINAIATPTTSIPLFAVYDPLTAKYYIR
jgi:hypothetical protein